MWVRGAWYTRELVVEKWKRKPAMGLTQIHKKPGSIMNGQRSSKMRRTTKLGQYDLNAYWTTEPVKHSQFNVKAVYNSRKIK